METFIPIQLGKFFKNVQRDQYQRITQVTEVYHLIEHSALDKIDVRFSRRVSMQVLGVTYEYVPVEVYTAELKHGVFVPMPIDLMPKGISSPVQVPLHMPQFPLLRAEDGRMIDAFTFDPSALALADQAARDHAAKFPVEERADQNLYQPQAPGLSGGE